jgi:multiple sugar transport system permease protein
MRVGASTAREPRQRQVHYGHLPLGAGSAWGRRHRQGVWGWLFVSPYLLLFLGFQAVPVGFGLFVSLHHWNGVVGNQGFIGLSQYVNLFTDRTGNAAGFWSAMEHTVLFVGISVPFLWGVPTVLAYLIYMVPGKGFFRGAIFFPTVLSSSAISTLWLYLLATTGGPVNGVLGLSIPWLVEQPEAWISIDAVTIWWTMGIALVIMYASLTQVPTSVLEAAAVDGAGIVRTFRSVVLPQLRGGSAVVVFVSTIASFNLLAQPFLMTHGGPGTSTYTVSEWIYQVGFTFFHMGQASAMAFVLGFIIAVVGFVEYRLIVGRRMG